jgi:RND family efflux transporter MFP subunit
VKAARASAKQAELNLDRTRIDAPFHAKILQRYVNAGSQVSPQTQLAHLVDVDQFWVEATVPLRVLPRLEFQENPDEAGVEVTIRDASGSGVVRTGSLDQLIGSLDDQTRMARILVRVEDPLQLNSGDHSARLLLGSFVRLEVPVREFSNVVRLNRDHVHPGETVWVMSDEDALEIREVEVAFRDRTHAYIRSGVDEGERVVTSQLATVSEGAALRVEETDSSQETEESQGSDS